MSRKLAKRWITADECERMGEAGIFPQDARLELIEGEIFETSPIGSPHAACVDALALIFNENGRRRFIVRVQSPNFSDSFSSRADVRRVISLAVKSEESERTPYRVF